MFLLSCYPTSPRDLFSSCWLHNTGLLPFPTHKYPGRYIPSPGRCGACPRAAACWGSCWRRGGSLSCRQTYHWSAGGTSSSWASASWCASWHYPRISWALSRLSRVENVSLYKDQRTEENIAGWRTLPGIFIWKSWEKFHPCLDSSQSILELSCSNWGGKD